MNRVELFFKKLVEILMPFDVNCSLCGGEEGMGSGKGICSGCMGGLPLLAEVEDVYGLECFCAFAHTDNMRKMVVNLKFNGRKHYARTLGRLVADCLHAHEWAADCIVPVPLHAKRRRQRGYNQSELIAREVGSLLDIPVLPGLLERVKDTRPQTELGADERVSNMAGAFSATDNVDGKSILLLDDVLTTGNTLAECAAAIQAGGGKCRAVAVARATGSIMLNDDK